MVFQHFALFETLTVVENIALALDDEIAPAALAPRIRDVSDTIRPAASTRSGWCTACRSASGSGWRSCAACCRLRGC